MRSSRALGRGAGQRGARLALLLSAALAGGACGNDDGAASPRGAASSSASGGGTGGSASSSSSSSSGDSSSADASSSGASGTGGAGGGGAGGGGGSSASPSVPSTATRPQLADAEAGDYTILKYLEKAGDLGVGLVADGWDPTAGLGDVKTFTPTYKVAASGGTHTTVQAAIDAAVAAGGTDRRYVEVAAGTYQEVICVPSTAPPITLYSVDADASKTVIAYDNYNGKPKASGEPANPCNPNAADTKYGTSGSATFAAFAAGFQAKNITIANTTDEAQVASGTQAVALMTQADRLVFENVRVLGNQDSLYVKSPNASTVSRAYFKGCYVEGDVDFIFGRGTFVLDGCTIHYLTARQGAKGGYILAPSTDSRNPYGILIINSKLTAEEGTPDGIAYLGRAWDEGQGDLATYAANIAKGLYPNGQTVVRGSTLDKHIQAEAPWHASTISRPFSSTDGEYPANRFYEYGNTGPGNGSK